MLCLKTDKGAIINLERIMAIITDFNESTKKYEVKAYYDAIHCNDLKSFEHESHAIAYVDTIYNTLRTKGWNLEI